LLTAKDLFFRLDKLSIDNALQVEEVNEFLTKAFGEIVDSRDFRKMLKTCSHDSQHRIDKRGFIQLIRNRVADNEKLAWEGFRNWGYDEDLYPVASRSFVLTVHSSYPVKLGVEDTSKGDHRHLADLEETVNRIIIQNFGKVIEHVANIYSLHMKQHEQSYTFSYGIQNHSKEPMVFQLDCSKSQGMAFSEKAGKVA